MYRLYDPNIKKKKKDWKKETKMLSEIIFGW